MNPRPYFKTFESYERYTTIIERIETEKVLLSQNLIYRNEYIQRIYDYDGAYPGMQILVDGLKTVNAKIEASKNTIKSLTKKYYELLKYFTLPIDTDG